MKLRLRVFHHRLRRRRTRRFRCMRPGCSRRHRELVADVHLKMRTAFGLGQVWRLLLCLQAPLYGCGTATDQLESAAHNTLFACDDSTGVRVCGSVSAATAKRPKAVPVSCLGHNTPSRSSQHGDRFPEQQRVEGLGHNTPRRSSQHPQRREPVWALLKHITYPHPRGVSAPTTARTCLGR